MQTKTRKKNVAVHHVIGKQINIVSTIMYASIEDMSLIKNKVNTPSIYIKLNVE